jgi:hypothetical protein
LDGTVTTGLSSSVDPKTFLHTKCKTLGWSHNMKWQGPFVGSQENRASLETRLSKDKPGVYLWRRVQRYAPDSLVSPDEFSRWILRGVQTPLIRTDGLKLNSTSQKGLLSVRPHYIQAQQFSVGGGDLGQRKVDQVLSLDADKRLSLYSDLIETTNLFGPVVYVGESECLLTRLTQHVLGLSSLTDRLQNLDLELSDVAFYYCTHECFVGSESRTLFESILTHLLGAPLTFRAG